MIKITKYLTLCTILVSSQNIRAAHITPDCDYGQSGNNDFYAAEGSAISSQIVMPDGSLVTNSKGIGISSNGIRRTFHDLRREADAFVSKTSHDGLPAMSQMPNIPFTYYSSGSQSGAEEKSYSQAHTGGAASVIQTQYQQIVPQTSNFESITKEQHEVNKKVISTKNTAAYPTSNSQVEIEQQNRANSDASVNTFAYGHNLPTTQKSYQLNQQHEAESIQVSKANPIVQTFQIVPALNGGQSSSSLQKFEISSQTNTSHVQPNFIPNIKPNTFTTGVLEFGNTDNLHGYIAGESIPQAQIINDNQNKEDHYYENEENKTSYQEGGTLVNGGQKEYRQNAVSVNKGSNTVRFPSDDINLIKTDEYDASKPIRIVQYVQNQHGVSSQKNVEGLPTSKVVIRVKAPESASQTYKQTSSASHTRTVTTNGQPFVLDSSNTGGITSQQQLDQDQIMSISNGGIRSPILVGGIPQTVPLETQMSSSSGSGYYGRSSSNYANIPILASGVPQNVDTSNSKISKEGSYYEETSSNGLNVPILGYGVPATGVSSSSNKQSSESAYYAAKSSDGVNRIPILLHGEPQTVGVSSKKSSSRNTQYYSSGGQIINEPFVPNSNYFGQGDSNYLGSTIIQNLPNLNGNPNAELCTSCIGGLSSSNVPVKSSYGISKSFSSSSSNINGKKSESRQASVAVNDNGKIDTYNVKS